MYPQILLFFGAFSLSCFKIAFFSHQLSDEERAVERQGLVLAPLAADVEAAAGVQRLEEGPEAAKGAAEVLGRMQTEGGDLVRVGGCAFVKVDFFLGRHG